jgi:hypothetical protein
MEQEIRGKAISEGQLRKQGGEIIESPVRITPDKVGKDVIVCEGQVLQRIDS